MTKITVIGDIVCDKKMLKKAKNGNSYNFDEMLSPLKDYFKSSDLVVANLDTTIGNDNYTKSTFSFCTPSSFLDSLKNIGISCISLANNHVLDRGYEGIDTTINELNKRDIKYFGIETNNYDGIANYEFNDIKLSVLGYTDATNYHMNKVKIDNTKYKINILRNTNFFIHRDINNFFDKCYFKLSSDTRLKIEKIFNKKLTPIIDNNISFEEKYLNDIKNKVSKLKEDNRYVIMYPHIGGQYNIFPGKNTKKLIEFFKDIKCDEVIITHPHIIQNMNYEENIYSIGGLIISPTSDFVIWDTLPQYSLVLNYYFNNNKLENITCSFLICVKDKDTYLKVYPFYDFYNKLNESDKEKYKKQFDIVFNRVFNYTDIIKEEYKMRV